MGSCCSIEPEDEETYRFIPLEDDDDTDSGRLPKFTRKLTDRFWLYFMGSFFVALAGMCIYCATIGDINRILIGYDNAGNVCGEYNTDGVSGYDRDMRSKPFLKIDSYERRECVAKCDDGNGEWIRIYRRCINVGITDYEKNNFIHELAHDLHVLSAEITYMAFISLGLVITAVLLLRYYIGVFIWFILIAGASVLIILSIILWVLVAASGSQGSSPIAADLGTALIPVAGIASLFTFIIVVLIIAMRKRIAMIIQLYKEASKAIGAMPHLLLQPLPTYIFLILTSLSVAYFSILLLSTGDGFNMSSGHYELSSTQRNVVTATGLMLSMGFIWLKYFYIGCQDMIVGGAVASWFFKRDKTRLGSPIYHSTRNLVRYHLGTVALGSFIMLLVDLARRILKILRRQSESNGCCARVCCCCLGWMCVLIQEFIRYFTKLAYIMTAMHSITFCKGGKEAYRLFSMNSSKVLRLNTIGVFVLFVLKIIIVLVTAGIACLVLNQPDVQNLAVVIVFSSLIAYFMASCFLTVYSTAIDTIFLCFCEDSEQNDGVTKPYFMSVDLMLFTQNARTALDHLEARNQIASEPVTVEYVLSSGYGEHEHHEHVIGTVPPNAPPTYERF